MSETHMRRFVLNRTVDETGISGIGIVAEGVEFHSGHCALTWLTATSCMAYYDNIKAIEEIHGHKGQTKIQFLDA
jgi:hypothetical protein